MNTQQATSEPAQPVTLPKVGDAAEGRGVYLGEWGGVHAYAADDFLRDANGQKPFLTFNEAREELANCNGGRRYGDGTEANIRQAITQGNYRDGDLVLPSKELLHGRDVYGNTTRPEGSIYALMAKGALPKVTAAVQQGDEVDREWALSGSEHPGTTSLVYYARLTDGGCFWFSKHIFCSAVVPVRLFRQP